MERYEFNEGASAKFWEVGVDGVNLVVRFGRIGANGQVKEKAFASEAAAMAEKQKLVREKTGKGYVAAGVVAAPVAAPKPAPEPDPAAQPEPAVLASSPERLPEDDVFLFNEPAPPTRLRPAPRRTAAEAREAFARSVQHWRVFEEKGAKPLRAPDAASISLSQAVDWLSGWVDSAFYDEFRDLAEIFAEWLVAERGAEFALRVVDEFTRRVHASKRGGANFVAIFDPSRNLAAGAFRRAMSSADESDYDAALAFALRLKANSRRALENAYLTHVLADDRPPPHALKAAALLAEAETEPFDADRDGDLLWSLVIQAPPSASSAWRERCPVHWNGVFYWLPTVIANARSFGESPLPLLKAKLDHGGYREVYDALLDTRDPEAMRTLLAGSRFSVLRQAFDAAAQAYPVRFFEMMCGATTLPGRAALPNSQTVRAALDRAAQVYPEYFLQKLLVAQSSGRSDPTLDWLAARMIARDGVETARLRAEPAGAGALAYLAALIEPAAVAAASNDALPSFLRAPPWRQKQAPRQDIVLEIAAKETPAVHHGKKPPGDSYHARSAIVSVEVLCERLAHLKQVEPAILPNEPAPSLADGEDAAADWVVRHLARLQNGNWGYFHHVTSYDLPYLFDALALRLWPRAVEAPESLYDWLWPDTLRIMLARFGAQVAPGACRVVSTNVLKYFTAVADLDAPGVAPVAARAFATVKKQRQPAIGWLRAYPRTALLALLPQAVGPAGEAREHAEYVVRWFKANKPEALDEAIAEYAPAHPQFVEAVNQVLERDPYARTPTKIAKLPDWLALTTLPRPLLKQGGALPDAAMVALLEMCSFVKSDDLYPVVPALRELCTAGSLAAFAWELFNQWLAAGGPAKEHWAFRALGWFGDDDAARNLTKLIRKWPGESAHARAVTGLDVLADIGSDVALLNLNGIAEKVKFKGLQDRARAKIAELAEARDLTPEDLADRLAPDFDLDARGGLDLDFGARKFRVGFDEFLRPWVKDAEGKRLKDLPKPVKSDDTEKATAASARWSALKKDVRAVASLQLNRLEMLLATGRRLKPEVFESCFAAHPLIRNLAQRLVWGAYETEDPDAGPSLVFRVADDLTYSDAEDNPIALGGQGYVGLVHPLHLDAPALGLWSGLFGDYEIAQPFPQLGRETFALDEAEKAATELNRFKDKEVDSKRLRGLASRVWRLGPPLDGGGITWIERVVKLGDGETLLVRLNFHDSLWAGNAAEEPETQTLETATLGEDHHSHLPLARLGAVHASEILRDIGLLVEAGVQ